MRVQRVCPSETDKAQSMYTGMDVGLQWLATTVKDGEVSVRAPTGSLALTASDEDEEADLEARHGSLRLARRYVMVLT